MLILRMVVVAILLAGTGLAAFQEKKDDKKADEKKTDDKKTEEKTTKLKGFLPANFKKLGLSDEQIQKVYKTKADYKEKIESLKAQIEKLKDEERVDLNKILTETQRKLLRELQTGEKSKDK
jgi:hypothetical protein